MAVPNGWPRTTAVLALLAASALAGCADDGAQPTSSPPVPKNLVVSMGNEGNRPVDYWFNVSSPSQARLLTEKGTLAPSDSWTRTATLTVTGTHGYEYRIVFQGLTGISGNASASGGVDPSACRDQPEIRIQIVARSDGSVLGPRGGGVGSGINC